MIKDIEISRIHPHYDNPRKDLGDLTELAESIKINGILQNLTVVPWFSKITGVGADDPKQQEELGYIAVIGHRRLAAAELAGLTKVPCNISDMSYRKQISTMLLENMQRSDLTIYEQAQGFQMMLDLGESVNDISKNTGFSESTVRRRVKLLEFDKEKFKESVERGGTLMDYAELDKIQDIKTRNKVLEKIGTPNFKWELKDAIDKETSKKNKALIIAELEKFATKVEKINGLSYVQSFYLFQQPEIVIPNDIDTVEYFYCINGSSYIYLYKKSEDEKPQADQALLDERRKHDEHRAALIKVSKQAYQLRSDFIKTVSNTTAKKNLHVIIEYLLLATLNDNYYVAEFEDLANFLGLEINEDDEQNLINNIKSLIIAQPERHLLISTYLTLDSEQANYYNWSNQYVENEILNTVYDFLAKLGYEISEEESSLRNGTHGLFVNIEDK
ncbi:ParB/RepB/Spo0J family partition protein [Anaerosinus massiliensis]|uniref:ParB/RepB/Spo0J family partition protein n=1 Tax=Massilibacillus massiliensis TaxID=1806837 RepID=UPI000AA4D48E|nr:ParB/RepB/Spo0J family partition protein [Massilibacillus massiliensis]